MKLVYHRIDGTTEEVDVDALRAEVAALRERVKELEAWFETDGEFPSSEREAFEASKRAEAAEAREAQARAAAQKAYIHLTDGRSHEAMDILDQLRRDEAPRGACRERIPGGAGAS